MRVGEEKELTIEDFFELCEEGGTYRIDTPDGWKDISFLIKKKNKECYITFLEGGTFELGSSSDHYLLTDKGWKRTEDTDIQNDTVRTKDGFKKIVAKEYIGVRDTFDLGVSSPEHRYYSNGIISHNTGKSFSAKAVANSYEMPLLRLDLGAMFGSRVGESERRIRDALKCAESVAPCLIGNTEILLNDGSIKTIEELYCGHNKTLQVWSCNKKTYEKEIDGVRAITKRKVPKINIIFTATGQIGVTPEHKMLIIRGGNLVEVESQNIKKGDFIASFKRMPKIGYVPDLLDFLPGDSRIYSKKLFYGLQNKSNKNKWRGRRYRKSYYVYKNELDDKSRLDKIEKIEIGGGGFRSSRLDVTNTSLNPKVAYVLGLIDSDGYISKKTTTIGFNNTCYELHVALRNIISKNFNVIPKTYSQSSHRRRQYLNGESENPYYKKIYVSYFSNKILKNLFIGLKNKLSTMEDIYITEYLKGYFDGDGCITFDKRKQSRVVYCTYSNKQRILIRNLLRKLGFITYDNQNDQNVYITSQSQIEKFVDLIFSNHPEKINKMEKMFIKNNYSDSNRYYGLPLGSGLKKCLKKNDIKTHKISGIYSSSIHRLCQESNRVSEYQRKKIAAAIVDEDDPIKQLLESDLIGIKVLDIQEEKKETDVFDLCCVKNHNFIANNLLSRNCLLWLDELEKGVSGSASSAHTDGGTTARVVSTLLTWMQEKRESVFIIATANNITDIPPELMRAGRFDEIFFIDLPDHAERADIAAKLLRRKKRNPKLFDTKKIALACENYVGAEIEKAIDNALFICYHENKRKMKTEDICQAFSKFVPLSKSRKVEIDAMREWAKNGGAVIANSAKAIKRRRPKQISLDLGRPEEIEEKSVEEMII